MAIIKIIIITDKMTVTDINIHPNLKILILISKQIISVLNFEFNDYECK